VLSESDQYRPNSYSVVKDDVSVPVHLDHVLKFGVGKNADGGDQRSGKFQRQTHATVTNEAEVIVFTQIGTQTKRIQRISTVEILATYKESFAFTELSGSGKHTVVGLHIQSVFVIRLYGSDGVLLLTIQVERKLSQVEMLEFERIALRMTVECSVRYESDHHTRGQLSGEHFLVSRIQIMFWNCKRLAHHTPYGVFRCTTFQSLGVCEKNRRHDFNFPHKQRRMSDNCFAAPITQKSFVLRISFSLRPTSFSM